jgi:predicted transcriptional regulator
MKSAMETSLADLLDYAEAWPQEAKDKLLRYAEEIEKDLNGPYVPNPEEEDGIRRGMDDFEHGRVATGEEIAATLKWFY